MGLQDRWYMQDSPRQRAEGRRAKYGRMRWLAIFTGPRWPLVWIATLLLLYVTGTLARPYLPNYGAVYCYVWTDYCLRR